MSVMGKGVVEIVEAVVPGWIGVVPRGIGRSREVCSPIIRTFGPGAFLQQELYDLITDSLVAQLSKRFHIEFEVQFARFEKDQGRLVRKVTLGQQRHVLKRDFLQFKRFKLFLRLQSQARVGRQESG